jgi:hypothetical protein
MVSLPSSQFLSRDGAGSRYLTSCAVPVLQDRLLAASKHQKVLFSMSEHCSPEGTEEDDTHGGPSPDRKAGSGHTTGRNPARAAGQPSRCPRNGWTARVPVTQDQKEKTFRDTEQARRARASPR